MDQTLLNGAPVPQEYSVEALETMLQSPVMQEFCLAVNALLNVKDDKTFDLLKPFLTHKDKYRRLYVFKKIFYHPRGREIFNVLIEALSSEDSYFVNAALSIISTLKIRVPEQLLIEAVNRTFSDRYPDSLHALSMLEANENNFNYLISLFLKSETCGNSELLAEILFDKYAAQKSEILFNLFSSGKYAKIKLLAIQLGNRYGFDISQFLKDNDGHVRKLAKKATSPLSFLLDFVPRYQVLFSTDRTSAILVNPNKEDHLYIDYDEEDFSPYSLTFSYYNVHLTSKKDAKNFIEQVTSEQRFAIQFLQNGAWAFSGDLPKEDVENLCYERLNNNFGVIMRTALVECADTFKIRSWSGSGDVDGSFCKKDNKILLNLEKCNSEKMQ